MRGERKVEVSVKKKEISKKMQEKNTKRKFVSFVTILTTVFWEPLIIIEPTIIGLLNQRDENML